MRCSWSRTFRKLAAMACIACPAAFWSAMCYAQAAFDSASDPVYADGWQAGDNGGFGLGPWDFTGTYASPVGQTIDSTSPFNPFGASWTLYNADAPPGPSDPPDPMSGTDISQAGRLILGNLQPGQTVRVLLANPLQRRFFRGYTLRLNTGSGNTVYAGTPQSRMAIGTFEYFTNGQWFATGTGGNPTIFDTDTFAGLQIDFTLTGVDTFDLVMTTLNDDSETFSKSGTLDGPAGSPIDWIEFELYNTDSDFNPAEVGFPEPTDFYIRSITIVPEPRTVYQLLVGAGTLLAAYTSVRRRGRV